MCGPAERVLTIVACRRLMENEGRIPEPVDIDAAFQARVCVCSRAGFCSLAHIVCKSAVLRDTAPAA